MIDIETRIENLRRERESLERKMIWAARAAMATGLLLLVCEVVYIYSRMHCK